MGDKKEIRISWSKLRGEAYQHLFVAAACMQPLFVEKPVTDLPWDFSVRHPDNHKKSLTVQVKGTGSIVPYAGSNSVRYKICCKQGAGNKHSMIDKTVVDVMALYVEDTRTWYNIPSSALTAYSVYLYPHNINSRGQYECWRYDWSVYRA